MKPLDIDVSKLTPGARELVQEFLRQFAEVKPEDIRGSKYKEISIPGRYRYGAARDAYSAIAGCGVFPNLDWSLSGVRFTLNSGIPNTVYVYTPPDAPEVLAEQAMGTALFVWVAVMLVIAAGDGIATQAGAFSTAVGLQIEAIGMIAGFLGIFGVAPAMAQAIACKTYKR
jgi:hypothetical protein